MALSLIVFDCDGVILESVDAKTKAFAQVAEPLGAEARDRLVLSLLFSIHKQYEPR